MNLNKDGGSAFNEANNFALIVHAVYYTDQWPQYFRRGPGFLETPLPDVIGTVVEILAWGLFLRDSPWDIVRDVKKVNKREWQTFRPHIGAAPLRAMNYKINTKFL